MPAEGIAWIAEAGLFELGYGVLFVRGVSEVGLSDRLDAEVLAERMNRVDAHELELTFKDESDDQVVRLGSAGGWAFAVAAVCGPIGYPFLDVIKRVSRGTEAVSVINNGNAIVLLVHAEDGEISARFELGTCKVVGANSGPLTEALRHAGLIPDANGKGSAPLSGEAERSMLRVAETHFDLALPRADVLEHELMAARVPG